MKFYRHKSIFSRGVFMKISVIVPIYKVEKYLEKCIKSIINQTFSDLEIILVDDGSPDNCPHICDDFARQDSRITVIHKENGGLVSARQAGLEKAQGELVAFVDGDDWIEPDMYERAVCALDKTGADIAITQFYYSYPDKEIKSEYKLKKEFYTKEDIKNEIIPSMLFTGKYYDFGIYPNCWTKIIRRSLLEKHLPSVDKRIKMGEDAAFTYACIMEAKSLCFVDDALYHYIINYDSMTKKYDPALNDIFLLPYNALLNASRRLGADLSGQLPYYLLYLVNFVVRNEASPDNPKTKKEKNSAMKMLINNESVQECMKNADLKILPLHTRLLVLFFKAKSVCLLNFYKAIIRRFL